jgi:hypothetical protein
MCAVYRISRSSCFDCCGSCLRVLSQLFSVISCAVFSELGACHSGHHKAFSAFGSERVTLGITRRSLHLVRSVSLWASQGVLCIWFGACHSGHHKAFSAFGSERVTLGIIRLLCIRGILGCYNHIVIADIMWWRLCRRSMLQSCTPSSV